jgi:putative transcriptional regulator
MGTSPLGSGSASLAGESASGGRGTGHSLANQLLIAMPSLTEGLFAQTVVLICEHSDQAALGIVLNKPLGMKLGDVMAQMKLEPSDIRIGEQPVLQGGPVNRDRGFVLHRPGGNWDSTHRVSENVQVTTSRDVLAAIARGEGPQDAFVALGYAGWEAGQLEREMLDNAWLSIPMNEHIVFDLPFEDRWQAAWQLLGIDSSRVSLTAGHA